ncbi:MAG: flagellar biosynthesis regulator FlaF [Alphaproteobacteria bacterium]|nr:flagellar biosynthesis regulator FlaF [Alphaproteobacteria bacterium]
MSVQAYQKAAARTEGPRQTEYRAFANATRALIDASAMPTMEIGRRAEALARNRQLWTLLASDCGDAGNQLPAPLRAQIISLSMFIDRHSSSIIREGASFDVLIDINRTVMQGLGSST